ncbi:hypothetical protein BDM02DRAFT_3094393 [Thelephora ganbajun]|uniref:Uncharacterized protein n=1 Tax=Thelephora ganbajun TaxID=370292 RepID=A0ACB6ZJ59_THEGA|nr:hypothetical protein BDM02DRAFT_3094393 [Thelephora ganbajun]
MKLPATIKQLLKLRGPNPSPPPPIPKLNGILKSTLFDAKQKNAETAWLVLTTCTLLTANLPTSVSHLYSFATRKDPADPSTRYGLERVVNTAALMRESAFKSTVFVGVPRVILSLAEFADALEDDVKERLPKTLNSVKDHDPREITRTEDMDTIVARGRILWNSIYEPYEVKLHDKLSSYHPDFMSFIIQAYGSVLSPFSVISTSTNEHGNLSRVMTSIVGSACLRAEGGVGPQLTSHVFGLLKGRAAESQGYEMNEEDRWLVTDEGTEWVINTVDSILGVVAPAPSQQSKAKL